MGACCVQCCSVSRHNHPDTQAEYAQLARKPPPPEPVAAKPAIVVRGRSVIGSIKTGDAKGVGKGPVRIDESKKTETPKPEVKKPKT